MRKDLLLSDIDTEEGHRSAQAWLEDLFHAAGEPLAARDRQAIWDALSCVAVQPRTSRTLNLVTVYLQVHRLKHALKFDLSTHEKE